MTVATAAALRHGFAIGDVWIGGFVLTAPMTGISDLPFRRAATKLGAPYVATEMVACEMLAKERPDVVRRAALGEDIRLSVVQLVGREARWLARGAALAEAAGADIIDVNMGCPAREVTGGLSGSALMRNLDHAESLICAAVDATSRPVTLKMRLGWDDATRNAPELAQLAEAAGVKAITVHGRTRQQFYKGSVDWCAVAAVKAATRIPVIVNGDITDMHSAREALAQSQADAIMIGRGAFGRPWIAAAIDKTLQFGAAIVEPDLAARLGILLDHLSDSLHFYGDAVGLKLFRKQLAAYVEHAGYPSEPVARRVAKSQLCRLETPKAVEKAIAILWTGEEHVSLPSRMKPGTKGARFTG